MNRAASRVVVKRIVRRAPAAALIVCTLSFVVAAQRQRDDKPGGSRRAHVAASRARRLATSSAQAATRTPSNADENFELNITERRITERDFFASTAIETGAADARGLSLRVGVAVGASEIDVLLRNVQGRVRFRGSLEALRRVLDARRPAANGAAVPDVP